MSARLPEGIVTFVFTDIEGSTRLFRRLGDVYVTLLDRHNQILRQAWTLGGYEVKTEGDAFFVAFDDTSTAIEACANAQRALRAEPWPPDGELRVRMGVHSGLAYPRSGDYIAYAVHQTARVVSAAHGGQVLVSADAAGRAGSLTRLTLASLGRYRLRDFDGPVELFQLGGDGLGTEFPAVRALPVEGHNLVRPRSAFIGRISDMGGLNDLVRSGRLVTVVGPGGVGKTRLVTEWGIDAAASWPDGVWMVDLSSLTDGALVATAIADAVGVAVSPDADPWSCVLGALGARRAAIVLDNCEHLIESCARSIDELLSRCPDVAVVATSREPIGIDDEQTWRLAPLDPGSDGRKLFIDRARAVRQDFLPTGEELAAIEAICSRLDGLPLAIELAAARATVLRPAEILAGLNEQYMLLRHRDRTVPERQRTLQALLDWSWNLLTPDERSALAALSVFASGFSLVTAIAALTDTDAGADDVAELVWSLTDKSLVVADLASNATRYRLLDTIRAYARMRREGDHGPVARRLAHWFLQQFGPEYEPLDVIATRERAVEIENVRGLIPVIQADDEETAQALAQTVVAQQGGRDGLESGLQLLRLLPRPTPQRLALLVSIARRACECGDSATAREILLEAEQLRELLGREPPWIELRIEQNLASVSIVDKDPSTAVTILESALARAETTVGRIALLQVLVLANAERGDTDAALELARQCLELDHLPQVTPVRMVNNGNLAELSLRLLRLSDAARYQLDSLQCALELGDDEALAFSAVLAARLAAFSSEWADVARLHAAGESILARRGRVLSSSDQALSDRALHAAAATLDGPRFAQLRAEGAALDIIDTIALTRRVLTNVTTNGSLGSIQDDRESM